MAAGCPERLNLEFLSYVWTFRSQQLPATMTKLKAFHGETIVVSSVQDVKSCLERFAAVYD